MSGLGEADAIVVKEKCTVLFLFTLSNVSPLFSIQNSLLLFLGDSPPLHNFSSHFQFSDLFVFLGSLKGTARSQVSASDVDLYKAGK